MLISNSRPQPATNAWADNSICCGCFRQYKISPLDGSPKRYQTIEIRPNRWLKIVHLNARPRCEAFKNEYNHYLLSRKRCKQNQYNNNYYIRSNLISPHLLKQNLKSPIHIENDYDDDEDDRFNSNDSHEAIFPHHDKPHQVREREIRANTDTGSHFQNTKEFILSTQALNNNHQKTYPNMHLNIDSGVINVQPSSDIDSPNRTLFSDHSTEGNTNSLINKGFCDDVKSDYALNKSADICFETPDHNNIDSAKNSHNIDIPGEIQTPHSETSMKKTGEENNGKSQITVNETISTRNSTAVTVRNVDFDHTEEKNIFRENTGDSFEIVIRNDSKTPHQSISAHSAVSTNTEKEGVVFFIHGVGGCTDVWQSQLEYLDAEGYECIAMDLIGHGNSNVPKNPGSYEFSEISQDILEVFDKYCKRRNAIIGHSYGCSFAVFISRQRPRFATKMVLISGGSPTPLAPQPGIFSLPMCLLQICRSLITAGFKRNAFHVNHVAMDTDKAFDVPTHVLRHMMNGQNWQEGDYQYHALINTSTLILHGTEDKLVAKCEEEDMHRAISKSQLIMIEGASHMVMMERPSIVNTLIHQFLKQGNEILGGQKIIRKPVRRISTTGAVINEKDLLEETRSPSSLSLRSVKSIPSGILR